MNPYMVGRQKKASLLFFQILYRAEQSVVVLPTKYLAYKTRANASPNTVKEIAFSLCYYLNYLESTDMNVGQVFELKFDEQHRHFTDFLRWLKLGCHLDKLVSIFGNGRRTVSGFESVIQPCGILRQSCRNPVPPDQKDISRLPPGRDS